MKWLWRIVGLGLIALALWFVWEKFFVSDETRVKRLITVMERAVEKPNLLKLSDSLATDYADDWGMDKSTLPAAVASFRGQYDTVTIQITDLTVTIDPDHQKGQAAFAAKAMARPKGNPTENEVESGHFRLFFRKTDDGWKLTRTELPDIKAE